MEAFTKRALKKALRALRKDGGNAGDDTFIVEKRAAAALADRNAFGKRVVRAACSALERGGFSDPKAVFELASPRDLTLFELRALPDALSAAAVIAVVRGDGEKASEALRFLFALDGIDAEELVAGYWEPERVLETRAAGFSVSDGTTRAAYRTKLALYAKRRGVSESRSAEEIASLCGKSGKTFDEILFERSGTRKAVYICVSAAIFVLLLAAASALIGLAAIPAAVPIAFAAAVASDALIAPRITPERAPRLDIERVPESARTVAAVAAVLSGGKSDEKIFERLLRFCRMCRDENVFFCLLADLRDAPEKVMPGDGETAALAAAAIERINAECGDRAFLFLRERGMNKSEGLFGGRERKRGAVCDLVRALSDGDRAGYVTAGKLPRGVKYLLTLDSDTNLSPGCVTDLVAVAAHPLNRAVIKGGRVAKGYGIIQPTMRTSLESAYSTAFSRMTAGGIGLDRYSGAFFRRDRDIFGAGSFCGKGLIDVDAFRRCIVGRLPDGLVLSHDVIEGAMINTLCVSSVTLTDSTPGNAVSFFRREHRWMRGDFQNLYFLFSGLIPRSAKTRLAVSAAAHLAPVFSVLTVAASAGTAANGAAAFVFAYLHDLLPAAITLVRRAAAFGREPVFRYFSRTRAEFLACAERVFFAVSSSCRRAFLALHALALAIYRLITRKKTLEWTTSAQAEKLSGGLGKFVLDAAASVPAGAAALAFLPTAFGRLAGALWLIYPLCAAFLSMPLGGGKGFFPAVSAKQKQTLKSFARDMWRFYADNVGADTLFLPPDNVSLSPVTDRAMRTSPTNVGFYLVSTAAANDFGFISDGELFERVGAALGTVEKLEKFRGNLYNWYSLTDGSVIGNGFVSSVDSGNFCCMLSVLCSALAEKEPSPERDELIRRCKTLIGSTELSAFYDKKKKLFAIGADDTGALSGGRYDLLMSEMRLTSYFAVARGEVPKDHWLALGRPVGARRGFMGMLSWSGTAFEYLMPTLLLPTVRDSFIYESLMFAAAAQRSAISPWGVSESGYYAFDGEMHYQYKANGLQPLALRRISGGEKVVSPYSSFLALSVCPNEAMKNLERLADEGMYGKYGMYEALDMNGGGRLKVKSYMAHHVGMSLCACANAVFGGTFVKRFMSDGVIASASELLTESVPSDAVIKRRTPPALRAEKRFSPREAPAPTDPSHPKAYLISEGDAAMAASDIGLIGLRCGSRLVAHTVFYPATARFTPKVTFDRGGRSYGVTPLTGGDGARYSFLRGADHATYIAAGEEFSGRLRCGISKSGGCFVFETRAETIKKYDVTLSFVPVLESEEKYLAHASFSKLFIETEYDPENRILYFHRRSRENGDRVFSAAVAARDKKAKISFLSTADGLDGEEYRSGFAPRAAVDPFCLFRVHGAEGGNAAFIVAAAPTKRECFVSIRAARCDPRTVRSERDETLDGLLTALLFGAKDRAVKDFSRFCVNDLWRFGIGGDLPFACFTADKPEPRRFAGLIKAFLRLSAAGVRFDAAFIVSDGDRYHRPVERALREAISGSGATAFLGVKGGLYVLRLENVPAETFAALKAFSRAAPAEVIPVRPAEAVPEMPLLTRGEDRGIRAGDCVIGDETVTVMNGNAYAPRSFVLTGKQFSSVVTANSLGVSFFGNAHERRVGAFFADPRTADGEKVIMTLDGKRYDVCACAGKTAFGKGRAVWSGSAGGADFCLTAFVCERYPVKLIRFASSADGAEIEFSVSPVMGSDPLPKGGIEKTGFDAGGNGCVLFRSAYGASFPEGIGFIGAVGGKADLKRCRASARGTEAVFFIGAAATENGAKAICRAIDGGFFAAEAAKAEAFAESLMPKITVDSGDGSRDALMNFLLPYQTAACRLYARGAFYQSGGAYGFRDQLQDCMAAVYAIPETVRRHIIRCCAHQYEDGTVMHWWHAGGANGIGRGVKTRCSDDMLFLPLAVAEYVRRTGDESILDVRVGFVRSKPLAENERERYELPERSETRGTVYSHCFKAFAAAEKRGKHGMIPIGSCDWNDAFSLLGEKGEGESVFTSLFFAVCADRFAPIMTARGDKSGAKALLLAADGYRAAVEKHAFFGDRYARAVADDGTVIGVPGSGECEIDVLPQAFAQFAHLDETRVKTALTTAFSRLYDAKNGIFKLFDPPFTDGKTRVGYVRGYAAGIRENGGQYTHAALWGAIAAADAGMTDIALKIIDCADPIKKYLSGRGERYKAEPYCVAADVYSGANAGRGGWTWYTGASGWAYKAILEHILGMEIENGGKRLRITPKIAYTAVIETAHGKLTVNAAAGGTKVLLDGRRCGAEILPPPGDHAIDII